MYIVINKKICMVMCFVLLAAGIAAGGTINAINGKLTFGLGSGKNLTVVVDAGHGGPDGGAVGENGTIEADINLEIAKKLCEVLNGMGIDTVMTRSGSEGVKSEKADGWSKKEDMYERMKILKKSDADLFVSIHMNHFPQKNVHGLRLFYAANHDEIKPLAEKMQANMQSVTGAKVSSVRAADKSLFLMKSPPVPAILAECGFLSNPKEEKNLKDGEYQSKLAWAIAKSIEEHFTE